MDRLQLLLDQSGLLNPPVVRDAWGQLSAYESVDIVSRTLEKRHGEIPAPDKATEVATRVVQGRQYFEAARHAETLIKPLLLYYGVLALSRAVILCSKIGLRETQLKPGHGVRSGGWNQKITKSFQVCSLSMEMKKGTFDELALATSNAERLDLQDWERLRYSIIRPGTEVSEFSGKVVSVDELLARIPDLHDLYSMAFCRPPACYPAFVRILPEVQHDYYVLSANDFLINPEVFKEKFGLHPDVNVREDFNNYPIQDHPHLYFNINQNVTMEAMKSFSPAMANNGRGMTFLVEPLSSGLQLSSMLILFLTSFALSTLVRYYPSLWQKLRSPGAGDAAMPVLSSAVAQIESRFPRLALEEIERSDDVISSSSPESILRL